jgi:extradiol dioxygenase family protein
VDDRPILHLTVPVRDLAEARAFYTDVLGCRVGRVRDDWFDVWFFGLQLTLQLRPDEVRPTEDQGVRHLGVILPDARDLEELVNRIDDHHVPWISPPRAHDGAGLSGKVGGKLADPSGNVIEVKHYADPTELLS